ncbi:MAG: peptidylprolyl isomerase [Aquabacterium sp.]|uniref:peptidylprolyl isomerase n=1 Tax=Aquabacterium sp. TaxID=1872578 RepID=UPI0011FAACF0|nr:peptidylprolyl isomerase [Aquabacterium sp.]TAK88638.1 MAG: peptidylprolyl isomerase [Aquabacterium sp.]
MKTSRIAKAAMLAVSISLAAPLAFAQNITTVNGKPVPRARVDAMMEQILKQQQPGQPPQAKTPELEQRVKDEIVLREIMVQEAERLGLQRGKEYQTQMEFARQAILFRSLFMDFEKKNKPSDAEVRAEYDKYKATKGDKEYRARHILVEKEEDAKALIAQLKAGAKFEDLAKKNSKDPGSAENGGDLDWANPGNYVPEFSQALTKLEKGQTTDVPVKSQFGYHIIKLEDTRAAQFPAFEEVKGQLAQNMMQQKLADYRKSLKKAAKTDYKFGDE